MNVAEKIMIRNLLVPALKKSFGFDDLQKMILKSQPDNFLNLTVSGKTADKFRQIIKDVKKQDFSNFVDNYEKQIKSSFPDFTGYTAEFNFNPVEVTFTIERPNNQKETWKI
jgi:hypothetical protein